MSFGVRACFVGGPSDGRVEFVESEIGGETGARWQRVPEVLRVLMSAPEVSPVVVEEMAVLTGDYVGVPAQEVGRYVAAEVCRTEQVSNPSLPRVLVIGVRYEWRRTA